MVVGDKGTWKSEEAHARIQQAISEIMQSLSVLRTAWHPSERYRGPDSSEAANREGFSGFDERKDFQKWWGGKTMTITETERRALVGILIEYVTEAARPGSALALEFVVFVHDGPVTIRPTELLQVLTTATARHSDWSGDDFRIPT
jgi:hypothetical protein